MAERVVSQIAGNILGALGSQVFREIKSAFGVEDEIEKLTDTVSTIKDVLADDENAPMTELLRRLKDALYDADDLLDDFATQLKQRKVMSGRKITKEVRIFFSRSNQIAYSLEMSRKIRAIREKLENIKKDNEFNNLKTFAGKRVDNRSERVETHSRLPEVVVGRDDNKDEIIKLLLESNDNENVSFIPIVGMGGLGKTTLAKLIYNDEQIARHFELRMWVCVSEQFHVKVIMENIIESATNRKPKNLQMEQLQKSLHEEINKKKYLLILDDIWNEDPIMWTQLKDLLINGIRGSKILVTTRSHLAAKIVNKHFSYGLKGLDKDKSWSLFSQVAFERGIVPEDSRQLVKIGEEIVEKCGGVPLVLSTIGSLLYINIAEDYWSSFRDNEMSKKIKEESDILPIIKFSYDNLPSHLKQCFAYCALFPKDFNFERQKLISLWMAQGFLRSSQNDQYLKDVGNKYFMDLLMRSFFQDPEYDDHGNVISCKMHDLMHDLARVVAGLECTMTAVNENYSVNKRCRHLSLDCGNVDASLKFPSVLLKEKQIRTLLLFNKSYYHEWNDHHNVLSSYSYLRALGFNNLNFEKLSSRIGNLKHLRYLNLFRNWRIKKLPNSITKLKNLETLDLYECRYLLELPKRIKKMVNLKDLIIERCESLIGMPHGLGALTSLETLSVFVVPKRNYRDYRKYGALEELGGLKNLRGKLEIRNLEHVEDSGQANYLENMQFLRFLELCWSYQSISDGVVLESLKPQPNLREIKIENFMGVKLSSWLSSITNLTSITLSSCERCQYIPPLDLLPHLKSLHLRGLHDLEYISGEAIDSSSTLSTTFFPSLGELTLNECAKLRGWWRRDDEAINQNLPSFACLSILGIRHCPNLTSLPLYPSIEEVSLSHTSGKALQQTMVMVKSLESSNSSSFPAPFSKLKSLALFSVDDLESLPAKGLQNLTSLVEIVIVECPRLSQLFQGIRYPVFNELPSLKRLYLENLDNLEYIFDKPSNSCSFTPSATYFPSLRELTLYRCHKLKGWWRRDDDDGVINQKLPLFACLSILTIEDCPNLTSLPLCPSVEEVRLFRISWKAFQRTMMMVNSVGPSTSSGFYAPLSKLKYLVMESIDDAEYISASESCFSTPSTTLFPSLKHLALYECPNLKGWWRRDDDDGATKQTTELPIFSCLSELDVHDCPKLTSMPLYPSLGKLYLGKTTSKPLQQTMTMMMKDSVGPSTSTNSSSFFAPLSKLRSLKMEFIDDLECLPEDGLRNLTSLVDMKIGSCPRLSQLPQEMKFLTSLQELEIEDCEELKYLLNDEDNDDMKGQGLGSLRCLYLCGLPKLESPPTNGLQFITSQQHLCIGNCEKSSVI